MHWRRSRQAIADADGERAGDTLVETGPAPVRRAPIPWFIGLFVLAAVVRSLAPADGLHWFDEVSGAARVALVLTLFFIGSNLTRAQLRAVGVRPFVHGLLLWIAVAGATLAGIVWGVAA
jgi:uncharacterized membrane protein YadS